MQDDKAREDQTRLSTEMSNEEYHASEGLSSSVVKSMGNCPAYAYAKHFAPEPQRLVFDETPAMRFGSAAHKMVLESDMFFEDYAVAPSNINKRTKAGKEEWAAFIEANKTKTVITPEEFDVLIDMRNAVYNHNEAAGYLMEPLEFEYSGWWEDEDSGMLCKYRPDAALCTPDGFILDYKTTRSASPNDFSRQIHNLGYHISAAHYLAGEKAVRGNDHGRFGFLVQETSPPYLVAVYVLDQTAINVGVNQREAYISLIQQCQETGVWPGLSNDQTTEISLPRWALS